MLGLFASLKGFLKTRYVNYDGPIFRLHSRWTVLMLLAASILVTCRQYFGNPIYCIQKDVKRIEVVETFCWVHATFILPDAWNKSVGDHVPHPGIDRHVPGQNKMYHSYYQWVAFVLLFQAILFYAPRHLWKTMEKGRLKSFTLNLYEPLLDSKTREKDCDLLVNCLHSNWGLHKGYVRKYIACELLALFNVIGQMLLMDAFLGGHFSTFGIKIIQWSEWDQEYRTDPMVFIFPRMTKCQFYDFGSSGDVQRLDALCLLPLNILNEKIYIFLWFWMIFLIILTSAIILYRLALCAIPLLRYCVLLARSRQVSRGALERLTSRASFGDWFFLYMLAKNMDPENFKAVVSQLVSTMEQNGHINLKNEEATYV